MLTINALSLLGKSGRKEPELPGKLEVLDTGLWCYWRHGRRYFFLTVEDRPFYTFDVDARVRDETHFRKFNVSAPAARRSFANQIAPDDDDLVCEVRRDLFFAFGTIRLNAISVALDDELLRALDGPGVGAGLSKVRDSGVAHRVWR